MKSYYVFIQTTNSKEWFPFAGFGPTSAGSPILFNEAEQLTPAEAKDRLQELTRAYPGYALRIGEWPLSDADRERGEPAWLNS